MKDKDCIFCKIIEGKIPSVKLYEDDKCFVILDNFPATEGQSLVMSKKHESYIINLDDDVYKHLFIVAKNISRKIDNSLKTLRTCFVVEGFEIDHVHIRLHPCYENKLLTKGTRASKEELETVRDKILTNNKG